VHGEMGYALENMSASGVEVNEEIRIAAGATIAQVAVRVFNLDHYEKRRHCTDCRRAYQGAKVVMETLGIVVPVRPVPVESKKTTRAARAHKCEFGHNVCNNCGVCRCKNPMDIPGMIDFYPMAKITVCVVDEVQLCKKCKVE
jgi:hypothetical protein